MSTLTFLPLATLVLLGCSEDNKPSAPLAPLFPDARLEAAVRQALDKPAGTLRDADLRSLTQLAARDSKIADLSEIQRLSNLQSLDLAGNQIRDITPLAGLTKLRSLNLQNNQVEDLSPLAGLEQLQVVFLDSNAVKDISVLLTLNVLKEVQLAGNPLSSESLGTRIAALKARGVSVTLDQRVEDLQPPFQVAYAVEGAILLTDSRGTQSTALVEGPGFTTVVYGSLAWSPDGQRLAFTTSLSLYVVDVGGDPVKFSIGFDRPRRDETGWITIAQPGEGAYIEGPASGSRSALAWC